MPHSFLSFFLYFGIKINKGGKEKEETKSKKIVRV